MDATYDEDAGEGAPHVPRLEYLFEQLLIQQHQIVQQQDRNHREFRQENRSLHARLTSLELGHTRAAPPEPKTAV